MAQPSQPASQSLTDKIKSAFGLPSQGAGPRPINTGPSGAASTLRRQDSFPEICSTPSEVGLFEVAHNKALHGPDGKFSWRKFFFEAPGSTPRASDTGGSASTFGSAAAGAAGGSGAAGATGQ